MLPGNLRGGPWRTFALCFVDFRGQKVRGQERADSLKSVVFVLVLGGCPVFAVLRFRWFRHKNPHVDGHIV